MIFFVLGATFFGPPWGHFGSLLGSFFDVFFRNLVFHVFLASFRWTNQQNKKWKSRFRYVNYNVLLGSPGWKKEKVSIKSHWQKHWFFLKKWSQIESKNWAKRSMLYKSLKKQDLPHFVGPLVDFRSIWDTQGDPKIDDLVRGPLAVIPPGTNLGAF